MLLDATAHHIPRQMEGAYDNWLDNRDNTIQKITDLIDGINRWRLAAFACNFSGMVLILYMSSHGFYNMNILYGMMFVSFLFISVFPVEKYFANPNMFRGSERILEQDKREIELLSEHFDDFQTNVLDILANLNQIKDEIERHLQWEDDKKRLKKTLSTVFNWLIPYTDDATYENNESQSQNLVDSGRLIGTSFTELNLLLLIEDCSLAKAIREHVLYPLETNTRDIELKYQSVTHEN